MLKSAHLLLQPHHPRQRKRSAIELYKEKRTSASEGRRRVSGDVRNCLLNDQDWTFDVLQLEKISDNHALSQLGIKVLKRETAELVLIVKAVILAS